MEKNSCNHTHAPIEAIFRSNRSRTGAAILDWARRLTGERQLTPWLHRGAEHRRVRSADEKLRERYFWLTKETHDWEEL